jgi:ABC-type uncharacterized transport system substrate-binding protein
MRARLYLLLVTLLAALLPARGQAVVVVLSERSAYYEEAAQAFKAELGREGGGEPALIEPAALQPGRVPASRLYVALGTEACAATVRLAGSTPVLCTLLPRASFERVLLDSGRRASATLSAIYLNQSPARQLDLVRLALPQARRIGMLWAADNQGSRPQWEAAAQARGLRVVGATVAPQEPVFNGLRRVLEESDVLLAVASPQIYNAQTIQNILLASFRARVPMLAFSPAYVRAGAVLAIYATPAQLGQQAAAWARAALQGQGLPAPQYPAGFEIQVNEHVARSLGLQLDAAILSERLRRLEQGS